MGRDYLTKRLPDGWSTPDGRITCIRDRSMQDPDLVAYMGRSTRTLFWSLTLWSADGKRQLDFDSFDTLNEADEMAGWWVDRIFEGWDERPEND